MHVERMQTDVECSGNRCTEQAVGREEREVNGDRHSSHTSPPPPSLLWVGTLEMKGSLLLSKSLQSSEKERLSIPL